MSVNVLVPATVAAAGGKSLRGLVQACPTMCAHQLSPASRDRASRWRPRTAFRRFIDAFRVMTPELAWEGQETDSFRVACLLRDWRSGRPAPSREGPVAVRCDKKGKEPIKGRDSASFSFPSLKNHSVVICFRVCLCTLNCVFALTIRCRRRREQSKSRKRRHNEEVGVRGGSIAQSLRPRAILH